MKYVYPAIFTPEDCGYSVRFPDIRNCFTSGEDLADAMEMAEDVLCMMLYEAEIKGGGIPEASSVEEAQRGAEPGGFVTLIACDTIEYRKLNDNRAIKKTLSIPSWLNDMAERAGINFSQVLQEALRERLNA